MAARDGHDRLLRLQRNVVVEFWRALGLLVLSPATRNRARNLYRWRRGHRQTRGNVMDTVTCCECGHVGQRDEHGRTFFEDVRGNWYCAGCALASAQTPAERRAAKAEARATNRLKAFLGMATERRINETIDQCRDETGWDLTKYPTPAHYQRKAIADYTGDNVSGQHIAIEAKSTKAKSWSLASMPEHQVSYLDARQERADRHPELKGGAFVLLDLRTPGRWYLVPWRALRANRIAHPDDAWLVPYEADPLRFWTWIRGGKQPW
jgi:hypothetical protein